MNKLTQHCRRFQSFQFNQFNHQSVYFRSSCIVFDKILILRETEFVSRARNHWFQWQFADRDIELTFVSNQSKLHAAFLYSSRVVPENLIDMLSGIRSCFNP